MASLCLEDGALPVVCVSLGGNNNRNYYKQKKRTIKSSSECCLFNFDSVGILCDSHGARTHDPNIKSVVLYQLS